MYHAPALEDCLRRLGELHARLCPRQVLGVRIGLHGAALLGLDLPCLEKRLLALVETDGCFADGVSVATGCWLGHRTLRLMDYGKVAATFVDRRDGRALRIWPRDGVRERARAYAISARSTWQAQLAGYQAMPSNELLEWREVARLDGADLPPQPPRHLTCSSCGEEVLAGRELLVGNRVVCRPCAGHGCFEPRVPATC
jgi:formylmethanofuran dehydrogenase subunit E